MGLGVANDPTIIDPFFRRLHARLVEEIDNRMIALARGTAFAIDGGRTTAENYSFQVGALEALGRVIEVCQELEHEQYGNRPKTDQ
jgi:hypothetical protein